MKDKMKARYLVQRKGLPQKKNGELTQRGQDEAFQFVLGMLMGQHDALNLDVGQSPSLFLLQVRGADDLFSLDKYGKEKANASVG